MEKFGSAHGGRGFNRDLFSTVAKSAVANRYTLVNCCSLMKTIIEWVSTGVVVFNRDSFSAVANRCTLANKAVTWVSQILSAILLKRRFGNRRTHENPSNYKNTSIFLMDKLQFNSLIGYFYKLNKSVKPSPM